MSVSEDSILEPHIRENPFFFENQRLQNEVKKLKRENAKIISQKESALKSQENQHNIYIRELKEKYDADYQSFQEQCEKDIEAMQQEETKHAAVVKRLQEKYLDEVKAVHDKAKDLKQREMELEARLQREAGGQYKYKDKAQMYENKAFELQEKINGYRLRENEHRHQEEEYIKQIQDLQSKVEEMTVNDKLQDKCNELQNELQWYKNRDLKKQLNSFEQKLKDLLLSDFDKWNQLTLYELGKYIGNKLCKEYTYAHDSNSNEQGIKIENTLIDSKVFSILLHRTFHPVFFDEHHGELIQQLLFMWAEIKEELLDTDICSTLETFLDMVEKNEPELSEPILQGLIDVKMDEQRYR